MRLLDRLRRRPGGSQSPPAPVAPPSAFDLDTPLLNLSAEDPWRYRDACEGCHIFGGTGSGKTSGSGAAIASAFLRHGFGGLVLTAKPDDRQDWQQYAAATGRSEQLIVIGPDQPWRFNFLDYELRRPGAGAGLTENMVQLFVNVLEIAERKSGGGGGNEQFWQRAMKQLLRNTIDLLKIARGTLTLADIAEVISTAPQSHEETESEAWQDGLCFTLIYEANAKELTDQQQADFEITARYWLTEFPGLAEKTRSVVVSTFTSMADCFLRGELRELFCTSTNVVPEMTQQGAVIVVDLPVKQYAELGQYAQVLVKLLWQRATERRDVKANPRPVFLWADEAQFFANPYDAEFQTTARSSRACTVYLSQNMPNYYAAFPGEQGKAQVDSLMGNLGTQFYHANSEASTNEWAADKIAKTWQAKANVSASAQAGGGSASHGATESLEWQITPVEFTRLRRGGPANDLCVDAIVFQGGRMFEATGANYLRLTFKQG